MQSIRDKEKKTPDELKSQIPLLREFFGSFGYCFLLKKIIMKQMISSVLLATKAASQDYEALIVTGDKDALQLIRPNLKVMLTKRGIMDMQILMKKHLKRNMQVLNR